MDDDVIDSFALRRALGAFPTGVALITTDGPEGVSGIVVNSFTSVSLAPPIVSWCLGDRSLRVAAFAQAQCWGVSVLAADQAPVSRRFAEPGGARAAETDIERLNGTPVLRGAISRFACEVAQRLTVGDHLVLFGAVRAFETRDGEAVTYFRGRYGATGGDSDR
jgi:flavin reductase (DIM6/NTAB) family NADH-FMN oxidoreductase RutF